MSASDLLANIDERARVRGPEVIRFMLDSCQLIRPALVSVAAAALDVAREFWAGNADEAALRQARVDCWAYLDSIGASTSLTDKSVCAVRCVICLLSPEIDDPFETANWFITVSQRVADIDDQQQAQLRSIFEAKVVP